MTTMAMDVVLPDWVTHVATDKDGACYGYNRYPDKSDKGGYFKAFSGSGRGVLLCYLSPPKNWTQEVYEVVR